MIEYFAVPSSELATLKSVLLRKAKIVYNFGLLSAIGKILLSACSKSFSKE